jgi:hypothetical protein
VVAVIYTHFHYVGGMTAVEGEAGRVVPVWGHEGIVSIRPRMGAEVSAAAGRGLVQQFGMMLPKEGADGLVNVFAIRGEEYRYPRVLLSGMDHLLSLGTHSLLGGPTTSTDQHPIPPGTTSRLSHQAPTTSTRSLPWSRRWKRSMPVVGRLPEELMLGLMALLGDPQQMSTYTPVAASGPDI